MKFVGIRCSYDPFVMEKVVSGDKSRLTQGQTADSTDDIADCLDMVTDAVSHLILLAARTKDQSTPIPATVVLIVDVNSCTQLRESSSRPTLSWLLPSRLHLSMTNIPKSKCQSLKL